MIEVSIEKPERTTILMSDMMPFDIGVIDHPGSMSDGHVVMRTASYEHFEVMDLSNPGEDSCWDENSTLRVRLLPAGTRVTLTVA